MSKKNFKKTLARFFVKGAADAAYYLSGGAMKLIFLFSVLFVTGCSASSLRCATDGDSSYVELYNIPQNVSQNIRAYQEVCAFAYEKE